MPSSNVSAMPGAKPSGQILGSKQLQHEQKSINKSDQVEDFDDENSESDDDLNEEPPDMRVYPEFLKNLPGVQASDSMGYRIEALRVYLETQLGD